MRSSTSTDPDQEGKNFTRWEPANIAGSQETEDDESTSSGVVDTLEKVVAWEPTEFVDLFDLPPVSGSPLSSAIDAERILEIFTPVADSETASGSAASFADRPGRISAWVPEEIEEIVFIEEVEGAAEEEIEYETSADSELKEMADAEMGVPEINKSFSPEPPEERALTEEQGIDMDEIKKQAEELISYRLAETQKHADDIIQQAFTEQQSVWKKAYEEGISAGQEEMESTIRASKSMLEEFSAWRSNMLEQSELEVLDLVKDIAKMIFSDGLELDQEVLQQAFSEVLINARALGDLRMYVNPEDARKLDPSWREYQVLASGQRIQILPTEALMKGGSYIEGQRGSVDARIGTQLEAILESLADEQEEVSARANIPESPSDEGEEAIVNGNLPESPSDEEEKTSAGSNDQENPTDD